MGFTTNADGPPMDAGGSIAEYHSVIVLNEAQLEQVGTYRILDLTQEQHAELKEACDVFPARMYTITPRYRMSTGEMIYGIWYKRNEVGIPHSVLESVCGAYRSSVETHSKSIERSLTRKGEKPASVFWKKGPGHWIASITIDHLGMMHSGGSVIRQEDIQRQIASNPAVTEERICPNRIFLSPPPSIDKETDGQIRILIEDIMARAAEKGVEILIGYSL